MVISMQIFMVVLHNTYETIRLNFMNIHNQIKQLSDRELLEGIYQMLLVVMQEQLISDSKQLGINVIADLLVDNMYRNRERNENNNNAPYLGQQSITI